MCDAVSHIAADLVVEAHAVADTALDLDHSLRQHEAQPEKDEKRPLPPERVEGDAEGEPPEKLEVGEEVKGAHGRRRLEQLGHLDPRLHPERMGPRHRVDEEHEENPRVDANVPVAHGADGGNIRAVVINVTVSSFMEEEEEKEEEEKEEEEKEEEEKEKEEKEEEEDKGTKDRGMVRRKGLDVPVGRRVRVIEAVVREELQRGALVPGRHHHHVGGDHLSPAGASLGHALGTPVDNDTVRREAFNVAADPLGSAGPDGVHDLAVHHGRVHVDALVVGRHLLQVPVEELPQQHLGDPRQPGLLAEDVHGEQNVHNGVAGDDPFLAARQDGRLVGLFVHGELQGLDGTGAPADDNHLLALGVFPTTRELGHLGFTAGADSGDDALKVAIGRVVDDPSALLVLVDLLGGGVELGPGFQAVLFPELLHLAENLLSVRNRCVWILERFKGEGERGRLLTLQIPPRFSRLPASKMTTSKPWPMQWAADVTPVIPAPMTAILGRLKRVLGSGGVGEKILSANHCQIWKTKRKGWKKGFSRRDSDGIVAT
ncbi:hypothetical protein CTA1_1114 [Colletotrichum tanaceti]|uniref:Uncharacterized protein n=1 Tax=Colletotrichum tanaceti TaxID=1306861 RepID=A0A4U6X8J3_9PEZI|nr:hypothetical protein CTA1_1114 [Colletotrichum tanaceti]